MTAPPRPPASDFRLVRYFTLASLAAFVLAAAAVSYFEIREGDFSKQVQQQQNAFVAQLQDSFAGQYEATTRANLLKVHEAGNVNLTRLLANVLWEKDFAPFVAEVQRIPVDRCRAIAEVKDAGGKTAPPDEKMACYAGIGKQIMALPGFKALDAKVFGMMKQSIVFKIKVYDLKGITVYSSEHSQIGEDKLGNAGWRSAAAGKPASQLTHRGKLSAFEGVVQNRDLIETYVPVMAPGSDRIVTVFEVYSDVTQFLGQMKISSSGIQKLSAEIQTKVERAAAANHDKVDERRSLLLVIVLGLFVLLYCTLFLIVRRGQRIIDRQDFDRKQVALALARQKDLYDALSHSNKAIVRLADCNELFAAVCRIAVEHGRFRFAWIGLIDESDQRLKPAARYGEDAGYIDALDVSGGGASDSRSGLTGRTLVSGAHVISNDFLNDPAMAPWREAARRAGVRASAKFPIRQGGAMIGAINFYAGEPDFFTEDLVATLDEIANDVSFALDNYTREAARRKAEEDLREGKEQIQHYIVQLEKAFMRTVEVAMTLSEMRDPYTAGHERRVAEIAVAIGAELGFDARRQEGLRVAGFLHDIGKITVPAEILAKPTKLTPLEYQLIKGHAQASYDVLKNVEFPWPVAEIALQHHERIDGSGYPQGLKGDAILLEARILAVADTIEAMSSHRPYRPGLGLDKSLAEIERGRGTVYDANVADACLKLFREKRYAIPV